ncbi:MAG: TetR/AcrR family transcriptional regulator [Candidatus Protistobacter heckmanni]|nr:TetR/AcrR family transcriptional regulator [Candidatus Protistobacter heckmanni]
MRYSLTHKQQSRQSILNAGSRLFRGRGCHGVGVDAVMAGAGLTPGGFYSHFASKEDLFAEAIASTASTLGQGVPEMGLDYLVRAYLSRSHRDGMVEGCLFAALTPDVARAGEPVKQCSLSGC